MMTPLQVPADIAVVSLELELRRLADKFPPGWPRSLSTIQFEKHGVTWSLRVGPPADVANPNRDRPGRLTTCQFQVLRIVTEHYKRTGQRIVARDVRAALADAGIVRGRAAVQAALTELVGMDRLINDNDHRGYGPPDAADEFGSRRPPG